MSPEPKADEGLIAAGSRFADRVRGALLGVAVGDALGTPVEGLPRAVLQRQPVRDFLPVSRCNYPPGTWSDDTSLTMCLASSLSELGRLDLKDVACRFVRWVEEGYWSPHGVAFGMGRTTRQAISRLRAGVPPEGAGAKGEWSNGNGSLMRTLPLPVFFHDADPQELVQAAHRVSALTHAHPRSQMACGILCLVAQNLLSGLEPLAAAQQAAATAARIYASPPFAEERRHFARLLEGDLWKLPAEQVHSLGYVVHTLEASLWCLCKYEDFASVVLSAVNLGGDADTTGAVAGGLAGLTWGESAIPGQWLRCLVRAEEIRRVAASLAEVAARIAGR